MKRGTWLVLAGMLAAGASARGRDVMAADAPQPNGLRVLSNRQRAMQVEPLRMVIRSEDEWRQLAAKAFAVKPAPNAAAPRDPAAGVNWAKEMVVAIFMGRKPTGGYAVAIQEVKEVDGKLTIRYLERAPGKGDITIQVLTAPYALVVVPKSTLPVVWKQAGPPDEKEAL